MGGQHAADGVVLHVRGDHHALDQLLVGQDARAIDHGLDSALWPVVVRSRICLKLFAAGILHHELEEEAVELGFGKRIGAFLLERVLRGHHEERLFELADLAAGGHLLFLHRFQQGRFASWAWPG